MTTGSRKDSMTEKYKLSPGEIDKIVMELLPKDIYTLKPEDLTQLIGKAVQAGAEAEHISQITALRGKKKIPVRTDVHAMTDAPRPELRKLSHGGPDE